jgi:hypothetical protein
MEKTVLPSASFTIKSEPEPSYQPIILEADYEIFQALLKNKLPPTYREWLVEQRSDIDVWIALWQDARREEIIRVGLSPQRNAAAAWPPRSHG